VFFHPAAESVFRGQSEVLNLLVRLVSARTYMATLNVVDSIISLAADTASHEKVPQAAMEAILSKMPTTSTNTVEAWRRVSSKTLTGFVGKHPMIKYHLERVEGDSKIQRRRCTFSVPFTESPTLYNARLPSKIAHSVIRTAFDLALGEVPIVESYNSRTAPYFTSLCKTFYEVMTRLQEKANLITRYLVKDFYFSGHWVKDMPNLDDWYHNDLYIQPEGNVGLGAVVEEEHAETVSPAQAPRPPAQAPAAPQIPQPPQAAAPQQEPRLADDDGIPTFKQPSMAPPNYGCPNHPHGQPAPQQYGGPQYQTPPPQYTQAPPQPQYNQPYPPQPQYNQPYPPQPQYNQPYPPQYGGQYGQQMPQQQPAGFVDPRTGTWRSY